MLYEEWMIFRPVEHSITQKIKSRIPPINPDVRQQLKHNQSSLVCEHYRQNYSRIYSQGSETPCLPKPTLWLPFRRQVRHTAPLRLVPAPPARTRPARWGTNWARWATVLEAAFAVRPPELVGGARRRTGSKRLAPRRLNNPGAVDGT
jgi:hypothetical protein